MGRGEEDDEVEDYEDQAIWELLTKSEQCHYSQHVGLVSLHCVCVSVAHCLRFISRLREQQAFVLHTN